MFKLREKYELKLLNLNPRIALDPKKQKCHDSFCFACGNKNDIGLKLKYEILELGKISTVFKPKQQYQSYENTLHGGIQSLILDACMVQAIKSMGYRGITGRMEIRYKKQVTLENSITINASVVKANGDFIFTRSEIIQKETIVTTAEGVYKKVEDKE